MSDSANHVSTLTPSAASSERVFALPVTFTPTTAIRVQEALLTFVLAPIALISLFLSAQSLMSWAAVGQPLSSPEASLGLALSGLLFLRIGISATRTSAGLFVMSLWAVAAAITAQVLVAIFDPVWLLNPRLPQLSGTSTLMVELALTLAWSQMPLLVAAACSCAFLAARMARRTRKLHLQRGGLAGRTTGRNQLISVTITALLAITLIWIAFVELSPTDVSAVAVYGPPALSTFRANAIVVLIALLGLTLFTFSAGWSALEAGLLCFFLLLLPSALILPVGASLTGSVAAPGAKEATALSLASPLVECMSLLLLGLTFGLHWVQTATAAELPVRD